MIMGAAGLMLHLWLIMGLTLVICALCMAAILPRLWPRLARFNLTTQQQLLWCWVLLPYLLAGYVVMLVLTPVVGHQLGLALNHHHLHYPQGHFHGVSWQGACVLLLMAVMLWWLLTTIWRHTQQHQHLRTLWAFAERDDRGGYRIDSDIPNAFTVGLWRPKILISRALVQALSAEELETVYRHELAHQQARDPLRLWLFKLLTVVFVPAVRQSLYAKFELLIEQQADAVVVRQGGDAVVAATLVAATLVKVHRLVLRHQTLPHQKTADSHQKTAGLSGCAFYTTAIEARVRQLLADDPGRALPALVGVFGVLLLASIVVLTLTGSYFTHDLHHSIEMLLHYHP